MSDPPSGAVPPSPESGPAAAVPGGTARPAGGAGDGLPAAGQRWRNYQLTQPVEPSSAGVFFAIELGSMEPVILVNRPVAGNLDWRRQAWTVVQQLNSPRLAKGIEAHEENGRRIEIHRLPAGETLPQWAHRHRLDDEVLAGLVRQVAEGLAVLHEAGLVHLNLRAENLWVDGTPVEFNVTLGGWQEATVMAQPGLIPVGVDPFFAPPEAAGLYQMPPGPGLGAWDWWSLGRVIQEVILGRNVYAHLLGGEARQATPEQRARAELMLLERDGAGRRAGAVEALPAETSPRLLTLLRGLLTSCRDGRWQAREVSRWLQQEVVPDRYDLPRDARLFVWRERTYTMPEAAALFCGPEQWAEGEAALFAPAGEEGSLLHFLAEVPALHGELARIRGDLALLELPAWQHIAETDRRAAITGLAWLVLGGNAGPGLWLRGRRVDPAGLRALLREEIPSEVMPLLRAVTEPAYLRQVEAGGGTLAAELLRDLARTGGEAVRRAVQQGWAESGDEGMEAKVYLLALETEEQLKARVAKLQAGYACNRDATLTAMMREVKPARWTLALLGFMAGFPLDYGFVTHAEWNLQTYQGLSRQAGRLSTAIFWQRLHRVMLGSPALLGPWPAYGLAWGIPLVLAAVAKEWFVAVGILLLSAGARRAGLWILQEEILRHAPEARPWRWRDPPKRCREEAGQAALAEPDQSTRGLLQAWRETAANAAKLVLATTPIPLRRPPRLQGLWVASILSLMVVSGLSLWQAWPWLAPQAEAWGLLRPVVAQQKTDPAPPPSTGSRPPDKAAPAPPPIYEEINDGFGKRMRGPLIAWDLPPPEHPAPLAVRRVETVNAEQKAFALVSGALLLEPYPRKDRHLVLAIRVPVDGAIGLVLYSGEQRALVDSRLFLLSAAPQPRTWYQVDTLRVVYLGEPASLHPQNSLALR